MATTPRTQKRSPARRHRRRTLVVLFTAALPLLVGACTDLRSYTGRWRGTIVAEPAVRQGFHQDTKVSELLLDEVALTTVRATLTTADGRFDKTPLTRFIKSAADELASLTFGNDPLRSYLMFGAPAREPDGGAGAAFVVISLFPDDRVHLRVMRGNDLYGVFYLERSP
ncbi:MAG: hypothetical protein CSA65_05650 [Proteobacteria bacterium]|nr:MAG: hypothetical protein CSB49_01980 [Pseudomonadota bacterium]PIE18202.1 MAG: hypothetical protein CSA65_05650 [Pseudomonadota bacterium]